MMTPELLAYLSDPNRLWALPDGYLREYVALAEAYTGPPLEARAPGSTARAEGSLAVLSVSGPIDYRPSFFTALFGGAAVTTICSDFRRAMADPDVKAVLFAYDSPGGNVMGVPELAAEITAARGTKPIVAQIDPMAASAASWLASVADRVVMTPSGLTGALGIITAHADISGALAQEGVKVTVVSAGEFKSEGSPFAPLSDAGREAIQTRVDAMYARMMMDVAAGRHVTPAVARDAYGRGRVLDAAQALHAGLIDAIGTMDETIGRLIGRVQAGGMKALSAEREEAALAALPSDDGAARFETRARRRLL